jgi:flotillin
MPTTTIAVLVALAVAAVAFLLFVRTIAILRRVVPTNEVHIVQTSKHTLSYGKDTENGNTYYEWPSWLPYMGVNRIILPVSVFSINLMAYEAYDKGRLPFLVDVMAFFRISDSNTAAQRVSSFKELSDQLKAIVQSAVRVILASADIEDIMSSRTKFGDQFTQEVNGQLANWGVTTVKNIELMDIRDDKDSVVIHNIMAKKKSHIEMESRTEVAKNKQAAEIAEINAQQAIDLQSAATKQAVGLRTIEAERQVELEKQQKSQAVKEQEKLTKEKEMAVLQVEKTRAAEIEKGVQIVKAQQNRETTVLEAQGQKDNQVLRAEGQLEAKRRESEGIALEGQARAEAEKALQLAPVQAQITLAKEIGENASYQQYLVTIRKVEAEQAVGIEQAKALSAADIKVIANTGSGPNESIKSVMDLFSAKGGSQVGAMLEGLAQTDAGQALLGKVVPTALVAGNKTTKA